MKKLKFLFVNNYFYLRGGSERVFFEEAALLEKHGNRIIYMSTDERVSDSNNDAVLVPKLSYSIRNIPKYIYSLVSRKAFKNQILNEKPDIIHAHNIYGAITPSILPVARLNGIPVVLTLHDYKLLCPTYLFIRDGQVCEKCKGNNYYQAVTNRCKGGSLLSSIIVALEAYIHHFMKIWEKNVTAYIAPSEFMKDKMIEYGWHKNSIYVVPNFLPLDEYVPEYKPGKYLLYMGRLSKEKGVEILIDAFNALQTDKELLIAGSGPLEDALKAQTNNAKIKFLGHLLGNELENIVKNAMGLIVPSICYENASMAILEAMAYGKPVVGASIGGIPEMINDGITGMLFEPGNIHDLSEKLHSFINMQPSEIEKMGREARKQIESKHSSEAHHRNLMLIYQTILIKSE